jgi:uncharacterized membrane protein YwaF
MTILLNFNPEVRRKRFSNQQLGMWVIWNEWWWTLPHLKIPRSKLQCSHIITFINLLGLILMENPTIRLVIFWYIGDSIQMYLMSDHSGQQIVILTTTCWWQKPGKD